MLLIGQCRLPLWRDWLRPAPGSPDVTSAIKFVGLGDLGLGGWDAGGKVGSARGGPGRVGAGRRPWSRSLLLIRLAERSLHPGAAVRLGHRGRRPWERRAGRREEAGSRGTGSCLATWASASGPSPESGLHTLEAGRLIHVSGGLRCEECVTFMSLASNGLLSLQLLQ